MEANNIHILGSDTKLIDALRQINILAPEPLVLFVVDEDNRMVGTLTDGDSRRALIAGVSVNDPIEKVIHRNFNFLRKGVDDDVQHLHEQKVKKMKLVPILDEDNHIVEIVNLDKYITRLPIDAVLMAGGKGERYALAACCACANDGVLADIADKHHFIQICHNSSYCFFVLW